MWWVRTTQDLWFRNDALRGILYGYTDRTNPIVLTGIYGGAIEVVRRGGWLEPLSRKSLFVGPLLGSDANRHLTNH